MLVLVLATFLPTLKPAHLPRAVKPPPAIVDKVHVQSHEPTAPIGRVLEGLTVPADVPMAVKPAFTGGPGAALFVKF
ncbi:MAG TPA: hypothetical protein VG496_13790 [Myxococcales bacterium]|nr:hypothetical protein [Myxococcales bacterium]